MTAGIVPPGSGPGFLAASQTNGGGPLRQAALPGIFRAAVAFFLACAGHSLIYISSARRYLGDISGLDMMYGPRPSRFPLRPRRLAPEVTCNSCNVCWNRAC